ncbi:MAG: hypothetical protein ACTSYB_18265 [Candidatus Helarchaeota archaeon]
MPKKEHIHIVTDYKHKERLIKLGNKYGSMTKAFEHAIELLDNNRTLESCNNCTIKSEYELQKSFREIFNTISFSANTIRELLRYFQGEFTLEKYFDKMRNMIFQYSKKYANFFGIFPENTFDDLLERLKIWINTTGLLHLIEIDKTSKKIITRVNAFEDFPVFVIISLIGCLEALNFTFDIKLHDQNITITWLPPEKYFQVCREVEKKIISYIRESEYNLKFYLIKQGFILVSPQFLDWIAENLFDYKSIPIDISYNTLKLFLDKNNHPVDPNIVANYCKMIMLELNYAEQVQIETTDKPNTFSLIIWCRTPNLTKILLQALIIMLSKLGWKLNSYQIDYKKLFASFSYTSEDDPTILEPLFVYNFSAYLNHRFQQLRLIPVDEFDELTEELYKLNPDRFQEIFHKQGVKIANAIKILAKNDLFKMRDIALRVFPQIIEQTQRTPRGISIIPEKNKLTLIFKRTHQIEMEIFRAVIVGILTEFNYKNINSRIIENMIVVEFIRPSEKKLIASSSK